MKFCSKAKTSFQHPGCFYRCIQFCTGCEATEPIETQMLFSKEKLQSTELGCETLLKPSSIDFLVVDFFKT